MSGAAMVVQAIADEGVSSVFGYSGGAVLPIYDAVFLYNEEQTRLGRPQLPLIVPANEQAAGSWPPVTRVPPDRWALPWSLPGRAPPTW